MVLSQIHDKKSSLSTSQITIMVVDDDRTIRELCVRALGKYRIVQAGTCEDALRLYEKEQVNLILTDIKMPGGSGLDLLRQVKAIDPNATVVMMTGFVDKEVILNALKEDADDFINKPFNILQLKTSIEKALGRKALKEELANVKRADELKNTFLSLVSHKLRTPITGISLFLQNLRMGIFTNDDPAFRQNVILASEEANYLSQLVADLLAFSRVMVDGAELDMSPCDLNELVAEALYKCRESHADSVMRVDFTPAALSAVLLDRGKIRFALLQVIDNAFKFSGKSGTVSVTLEIHGDAVRIVVSDMGSGIPEAEIPRVFDKFYQIDPNHTGQIRGFGLGLFYAREFVRQHGGNIAIVSKPGMGTTVTISLPLQ